jgi:cytochrome c oxidase subunit 4
MSHSAEDVRAQVKTYITIFAALMVLTVVTVAVSYIHLPSITQRVGLALIVAGTKASLVAIFFMHLKGERQWVTYTLALTGFFLVLVFWLPKWTDSDHIVGTSYVTWDAGVPVPELPGHETEAGDGGAGHEEAGH